MKHRLAGARRAVSLGLLLALASRGETADSAPSPSLDALVLREFGVSEYDLCEIVLPPDSSEETFRAEVELEGSPRVLHLRRHSVRGAAYRVLVQGADAALRAWPAPPPRTYRGTVEGEEASGGVAASLLGEGLYASWLRDGATSLEIRPLRLLDPGAKRSLHIVFDASGTGSFSCGVDGSFAGQDDATSGSPTGPSRRQKGVAEACDLHLADIAFDSDYEFFEDDCNHDEATCVEIVETGLNIANLIYNRDVKIDHRISAIVIRTDPVTDFWARYADASSFGSMLPDFRSEWNAKMRDLDYDIAYYLTGKPRPNLGGLAYVGVVCSSSRYGMGIGRRGYEGIFRHEVGHNWSASHSCGTERRYIMCGNSIAAISAYNIQKMTSHRDSRACLDTVPQQSDPGPPYPRLDRVLVRAGEGPVAIDVIRGDSDPNCDRLRIASHDSRSAFGASLRRVDGLDPAAPEILLYSPRSDVVGTDYFRYTVSDGAGFEAESAVLVELQSSSSSLIVYLPLDETEGTEVADLSGFDHEGEMRGELSFETASVAGRHGRGLRFSGVDGEYVSLGDDSDFDLRSAITVALWFRLEGAGIEGETLVGKGSSAWRLERNGPTGGLSFTGTGLAVEGSPDGVLRGRIPVSDGEWHHAAGVYDGERISLYIDGGLDGSRRASGRIGTNSSSLRIGDGSLDGVIDELRIYRSALDAGEVEALYLDARIEAPSPVDGATNVLPRSTLSWLPSPSVSSYEVYVGTDRDAVARAGTGSPEYRGRTAAASFSLELESDESYSWRVDPVSGGRSSRGAIRGFHTGFAFTGFDEPGLEASSFTPRAGDREIGFRTVSSPTGGEDPLRAVVNTGSTPTSPIFAHRSVEATTTFDAVDLSDRGETLLSLIVQARSTGYEPEDFLEVLASNGEEELEIFRLNGGAELSQRAGAGYATVGALLPASWEQARLVLRSSSNSSSGSERYDFDQVVFSCQRAGSVLAHTYFLEATAGEASHVPSGADRELGFETVVRPTGGASPLAAVVAAGASRSRYLAHRSVEATTTFAPVDLSSARGVRVAVVLRVRDTGYEGNDALDVFVRSGVNRLDLVSGGAATLDGLADDRYLSFQATIPDEWSDATLVITSSSNSSNGSEQIDITGVEFLERPAGDPCSGEVDPPGALFLRGDANADGQFEIVDPIAILRYQFLGDFVAPCLDALDFDDDGETSVTDAIANLGFQFLGTEGPRPPGKRTCGVDPTPDDALNCESYPAAVCPR